MKLETLEDAHVTIMFGPKIRQQENAQVEIIDPERANELYSDAFISKYKHVLPTLRFSGVSHFERPDQWVIKLDFESDELTGMRRCILENVRELETDCETCRLTRVVDESDHSFDLDPVR